MVFGNNAVAFISCPCQMKHIGSAGNKHRRFNRRYKLCKGAAKAVQISITAAKPASMPKLKGSAPLKPSLPPLLMDIILLGPGVAAVITA